MKHAAILTLLLATSSLLHADVIKRGAAVPADSKAISISEVISKASDYEKTPVVVEGVIANVCENKGCWMELVPEAGKAGMRVTFKDYAFFVPIDSKGMKARAEGVTVVKTLSKKNADHLESEGAKLTRNADGTATEVSFVANGVELTRP